MENKEAIFKLNSRVAYRNDMYIVIEAHGEDEYTIKKDGGRKSLRVKRFGNTLCAK